MSPWLSSLLAIAVVSAIPLAVTLLLAHNAGPVQRFLPGLTALGAGALAGAAAMHLVPEALASGQSVLVVAAGVAGGYGAFALVERLLASHDHAHAHGIELGAPEAHHDAAMAPVAGVRRPIVGLAFAGDALHNLVDGVLIAAGFLANPGFGLLTAIAIGVHELPREVGTYGIFVHAGVHPLRAVSYNVATALISFVGAAATLVVGTRVSGLGTLLLPVAAGSYLYIAVAVGVPAMHGQAAPGRDAHVHADGDHGHGHAAVAHAHDGVVAATGALSHKRAQAAWLASGFALMGLSAVLAHSF